MTDTEKKIKLLAGYFVKAIKNVLAETDGEFSAGGCGVEGGGYMCRCTSTIKDATYYYNKYADRLLTPEHTAEAINDILIERDTEYNTIVNYYNIAIDDDIISDYFIKYSKYNKMNKDDFGTAICEFINCNILFNTNGFEQFYRSFNMLSEIVSKIASDKGWDMPTDPAGLAGKIALMHSELSEALESLRCGDPPSEHIPEYTGQEEEFADTIIRIMHYSHDNGLRVAEALVKKLLFNEKREYKHGGKLV